MEPVYQISSFVKLRQIARECSANRLPIFFERGSFVLSEAGGTSAYAEKIQPHSCG